MKIIDNFIDDKSFKNLSDAMFGVEFPWYYNSTKSSIDDQENFQFKSAINISAKSGEGIDNLLEVISSKVKQNFVKQSTTVPTKTRYILGVQKTVQSLLNAKNVNLISQTELIVEELRLATNEIGRLTGAVDVEEYLEVIFRDFCIGK